jgi:hypothetical protein
MRIISHRGFWRTPDERNTETAFRRAFEAGVGVETDLRDALGRLVISHDPPGGEACTFRRFLEIYLEYGAASFLALNIKADGLQTLLSQDMSETGIERYFLFDMSIPDTLISQRHGLPVFVRQSEVEPQPYLYKAARGVWMDCFYEDWITEQDVVRHLHAGKHVCLVSPELHGRDPAAFWERLSRWELTGSDHLMLCTDYPDKAEAAFNGKNRSDHL